MYFSPLVSFVCFLDWILRNAVFFASCLVFRGYNVSPFKVTFNVRYYSNPERQGTYIQTPVSIANRKQPQKSCGPPVWILTVLLHIKGALFQFCHYLHTYTCKIARKCYTYLPSGYHCHLYRSTLLLQHTEDWNQPELQQAGLSTEQALPFPRLLPPASRDTTHQTFLSGSLLQFPVKQV